MGLRSQESFRKISLSGRKSAATLVPLHRAAHASLEKLKGVPTLLGRFFVEEPRQVKMNSLAKKWYKHSVSPCRKHASRCLNRVRIKDYFFAKLRYRCLGSSTVKVLP